MRRKKLKPKFVLLAAVSLDGRITRGTREGSDWTSKEDKKWFQDELDHFDAVVMGRKTFEAVTCPPKPRNRIVFTRSSSVIPLKKGIHSTIPFIGPPTKLDRLLKLHGFNRVAVLGGTSVYDWFLKRALISEIYLTLEPVIFGSGKPLSARALQPFTKFYLVSIHKLNPQGTLLLHYKIDKTDFTNTYGRKYLLKHQKL